MQTHLATFAAEWTDSVTDDGQTVVKIPASDDNADYRKILELERASGFTCRLVDGMG